MKLASCWTYPQHANFVVRLPWVAGVGNASTGFSGLDVGRVAGVEIESGFFGSQVFFHFTSVGFV